jgi:hypothetical protein
MATGVVEQTMRGSHGSSSSPVWWSPGIYLHSGSGLMVSDFCMDSFPR